MKLSFIIATIILVVGGIFITRNQHELIDLKLRKVKLVAKATSLGISGDPSNPDPKLRYASHIRNQVEISQNAKNLSKDLLQLVQDMEEMASAQDAGNSVDDADLQARAMELFGKLSEMSSAEIKYVIGELDQITGIPKEMEDGIKGLAIMLIAEKNPSLALDFIQKSNTRFHEQQMRSRIVTEALSLLAREDPLAAKKWLDQHGKEFSDAANSDTQISILTGSAKNNPVLAFQMLKDLDPDQMSRGAAMLAQTATTNEERTALLQAMRSELGNLDSDEQRQQVKGSFISSLTASLARGDFESSTAWLDEANFSQEENALIAGGMQYANTLQSSGEWIAWMSDHMPSEQLAGSVNNLVSEWTRNDYQSAGKWLQQAPDDAAKAPAVQAYARSVAPYEPEIAEQWALTLPASETRDQTLQMIRSQWPESDPDGKAAFEKRHGLK
ncbi:hypothetical protein JIN85_07540 [Luteolibacter pohnpeiensis]|uniref:Uncharacterized protein n=1 Tax=Luteolibacter pohnpeiensis TaxID=454153 RepID=A0A934VU85_9BACT|nr:hypothetical protein [Luteolibacter pohnpeiensis]MBK1882262.1 hypothetical protein [Luteolibacter pohnpeiensis]